MTDDQILALIYLIIGLVFLWLGLKNKIQKEIR